ncbi:hypothetical protein [Rhizobium leguminosarum]|uniref:hypothetical protein n=1 Tax=Rhizobium leguminosarum TaxID=384 RepID=UPI00103A7EFA|nr:hypothetical protein [Rhizobium leguminosarum]TBY80625.1 hypothetical protein E0H32_19660 [Rhizobium leguminosarum bv. viciae]TBZ14667.1 hypothetical protein E0H33_15190 [Rhizobium leguminosarum bv. viciae]
MPARDETFEEFMKRRESVSLDYINGSPWTLIDISTSKDPATFLSAFRRDLDMCGGGECCERKGASSFKEGKLWPLRGSPIGRRRRPRLLDRYAARQGSDG